MNSEELRAFLVGASLSGTDFARLLDITPRAVAMWLSGERSIPGPVAGYARMFSSLPPSSRAVEMLRIRHPRLALRDGMYGVMYFSGTESGYATLILEGGRVYGADAAGGKYDGEYSYNEGTGMATVHLKVTFPPNVRAVFGPSQPFEWSIDLSGDIDPSLDRGAVEFAAPLEQKIEAQYQFLRELPAPQAVAPAS